ncbi:MAG: DegV family protein [Spirochaetales bacterium]|nr:DegV family protein [Spirochaetales bacterium]
MDRITDTINGFQLYQAFLSGYFQMAGERERMNRMNVFPVQDGDTGSNMVGTLKTVADRLHSCRSAGELLERIAHLSLEGARGNSGMILSQYLNGLARQGKGKKVLTLPELSEILSRSVEEAYGAVEVPREGTMLSVLRVWAEAVKSACSRSGSVEPVMKESLVRAKGALEKTPDQLEVLKKHHVVDAGALGVVSFIEGIVKLGSRGRVSTTRRREILKQDFYGESLLGEEEERRGREALTYRYCTEILLETDRGGREEVKRLLSPLGDSLIVTEGVGRLRVHIHCDEPDRVVSLLRSRGRVIQQKADDMVRQEQIVTAPLGKIALVTDSIADLPRELRDQYQVHMLHHSLIWGEEEYLDRLTITPETFYRMQQERSTFPESTFPGPARTERFFRYLLEHYEGILVLPVSRALSGTWRGFSLAAEKFNGEKKRIEVVDTRLNSVAQGLLVLRLAREAAKGRDLDELTRIAEELRGRIKIFVSVKTFKYMVRGGRVSRIKGLIGRVLNVKPIVSLDGEGRGIALDKSFSSRRLMKKISRIVRRIDGEKGIEEFALVHASDRERGEQFAALASEALGQEPTFITNISPIVGMHAGKGTVALGIIEGGKDD